MTDYYKTTGSTGQMMIRDTGSDVEFWFKAGYSNDWWSGMPFNWTANGTTTSKTINYPTGAQWYKVGEVLVTSSQTVTFRLTDGSSSSGIGGPTSFPQFIQRDTLPGAPTTPVVSGITATSVYVTFSDGSNGGDAIDTRQIGYGTNSSSPQSFVTSDRSTTIGGLAQGTTYYFWARTHNSLGWGPWSGRATAKTLKTPDPPTAPILAAVRMTSVDAAWAANSNGGSSIIGFEIGYSTSSTGNPTTSIAATSPTTVTGLSPGVTYYFRVRAKNSVGWSSWSSSSSIRTIAGVYIKSGATWKLAVPYVRSGGVWKIAEPWVRSVGVWKRTT